MPSAGGFQFSSTCNVARHTRNGHRTIILTQPHNSAFPTRGMGLPELVNQWMAACEHAARQSPQPLQRSCATQAGSSGSAFTMARVLQASRASHGSHDRHLPQSTDARNMTYLPPEALRRQKTKTWSASRVQSPSRSMFPTLTPSTSRSGSIPRASWHDPQVATSPRRAIELIIRSML